MKNKNHIEKKTSINHFINMFVEPYSIHEQIVLQKDEYQLLYHAYFESFSIQEIFLILESNYQLLHYTFFEFCSNHKQALGI